MLSASPLPRGVSEYDFACGLRGEPIDVIRSPYTASQGVWNHEGGPATRFTEIQIRQL